LAERRRWRPGRATWLVSRHGMLHDIRRVTGFGRVGGGAGLKWQELCSGEDAGSVEEHVPRCPGWVGVPLVPGNKALAEALHGRR
jgi:hypothetical protein